MCMIGCLIGLFDLKVFSSRDFPVCEEKVM